MKKVTKCKNERERERERETPHRGLMCLHALIGRDRQADRKTERVCAQTDICKEGENERKSKKVEVKIVTKFI